MSDEPTGAEPDEPRRAPSAKAAAASRARRIGGRSPGAAAVTRAAPAADPADPAEPAEQAEAGTEVAEPIEPATATSLKKASAASRAQTRPATRRKAAPAAKAGAKPSAQPAAKPSAKPSAEPVAKPGTASESDRPGEGWLLWLPAALLSAAALVFGILIAVDASSSSGSGGSGANGAAKLRETVLAATKQCVAQANTYDYRTMTDSEAKAQACTTGKYKIDNRNTFEKVLKPKVGPVHATQTFQTDVAGVESVSEDGRTWKILLFGQNHAINDGTGKEGRYDPVAVDVTMTKVGSKWLISQLIPV